MLARFLPISTLIGLLVASLLPIEAGAAGLAAILADKPPKLLSEFGFFSGPSANEVAKGVVSYDLVTPLFSDNAVKFRYVVLPDGKAARYDADEVFDFPVGTVLIKSFTFPADFREPDSGLKLIETRLLLRQEAGWVALAYVWNDDQSDAELKVAGKRLPVSFIDKGGNPVSFEYAVPNRNQCKGCHAINGEISPIGPKARNLNHTNHSGVNQLETWIANGMLDAAPDVADMPAAADWLDESQTVEMRARTWLDVNCAHCHRREGAASNSGLFLTFGESEPVALGILKRPVAAGRGAGNAEYDIVPGKPDASILLNRVASVEPGVMMPELGRNLGDPGAVALLRAWILSLR
ncbi:MAG: SO2930 family diheme c-type cytochrome [Nitratireductor sp.]